MKFEPMKPQPPVTSTFIAATRFPSCSAKQRFAAPHEFPVSRFPPRSYDADLRVVSDQEAVDAGPLDARVDADVRSDQGIGDAAGDPLQPRTLENDRVLDLATLDEAVRPDRRVGTDEGVPDLGARSDDGGPPDRRAHPARAGLDPDPPPGPASRGPVLPAPRRA